MCRFSHRDYFRKFKVGVGEYGEILVEVAFGGQKKGDWQPGFDIAVKYEDFEKTLRKKTEATEEQIKAFLSSTGGKQTRIEVKSKLFKMDEVGVVDCGQVQFDGKRKNRPPVPYMTHMAIVFVPPGERRNGKADEEGEVDRAFLITLETAGSLRTGKNKNISGAKLRSALKDRRDDFVDITRLLRDAAESSVVD